MDFNSYYNDFLFWMSKYLRSGWGMEMRIYPFSGGAVIVINMSRGTAHNLVKKGESKNLGDALRRTNLFTEDKIRPIADKGVDNTLYGIISTTQYVLFKNSEPKSWDEASAKEDVDKIITKVKANHGKR